MQRLVTSLLFAGLFALSGAYAAEPEWIAESNRQTQVLLELDARYTPESSADLGVEGHDSEIFDL